MSPIIPGRNLRELFWSTLGNREAVYKYTHDSLVPVGMNPSDNALKRIQTYLEDNDNISTQEYVNFMYPTIT